MLRVLLKKQLSEVFKGYFYDAKKNRMRSGWAIAGYFVLFLFIMVGILGGMFTSLSLSLCGPLADAGLGWLYFLIMGGIAVLMGAFGSVFNAYTGLYLGKDNDLLLSLPIPIRTIVTARLANVYLMGIMYSAVVFVPALIVSWIETGASAARVICGILLYVIVSFIVLLLSCLLGWVVAKISLRLKNKSFITVIVSLLFIAAYYFCYFKANDFIRALILNADVYGERIKGAAYGLYLFGRVGEGDWTAAVIFTSVMAAICAIVWTVLIRSFLNIATASGKAAKVRYTEKPVREKTPFRALLGKEFGRFASSPNYMLNCGLGVLLLPICGILLVIKGKEAFEAMDAIFANLPDSAAVLLCAVICLISCMNDMASPSVSLEGKSLWIPQSLPVEPRIVLRAKASVQMILTAIPVLIAAVCAALVVDSSPAVRVQIVVLPLLYSVFSALYGTVIGVRMPLLSWTNEIAPIKQSGAVMIALFGGWIMIAFFAGLYLLFGAQIGAGLYLLIWNVLFASAALLLLRWLDTRGAAAFAEL